MDGSEEIQAFAYERKGNSAVIRRCFSRDTKAAVPGMIDGLPVTELAPYAFSAHLDFEKYPDPPPRPCAQAQGLER